MVHDGEGTFHRVQVKARRGARDPAGKWLPVRFPVSRTQLYAGKRSPLFYMFLLFQEERWQYVLLSQSALGDIRTDYELRGPGVAGRPAATAETARGDDLGPTIAFSASTATFWGVTLPTNAWHPSFPELNEGPGARAKASSRAPDP